MRAMSHAAATMKVRITSQKMLFTAKV